MKKGKSWVLLLALLPLWAGSSLAVSNSLFSSEYTYHSVFIYNFLKYIEWPASAGAGSELVIGVVGSADASTTSNTLQKLVAGKTAAGRKITVKSFTTTASLSSCQVVFLPNEASEQLAQVLAFANDKPILIITEKAGLGKKGSGINFINVNNTIAFEVAPAVPGYWSESLPSSIRISHHDLRNATW